MVTKPGALSRHNLSDLAWRFEPATPQTWGEHFINVLPFRLIWSSTGISYLLRFFSYINISFLHSIFIKNALYLILGTLPSQSCNAESIKLYKVSIKKVLSKL